MTLDEILRIVRESKPTDWDTLDVQTLHAWSFSQSFPTGPKNPVSELEPKMHSTRAIYKPDIDISLVWGAEHRDDYHAPWMPADRQYPDPNIASAFFELRYRGEVVQYWIMIYLDGFRILIPTPDMVPGTWNDAKQTAKWYVATRELQIGQLFAALALSGNRRAAAQIPEALERIGIEIRP